MLFYGTANKTYYKSMSKKCKKKDYKEPEVCNYKCEKCNRKAKKQSKLCKPVDCKQL